MRLRRLSTFRAARLATVCAVAASVPAPVAAQRVLYWTDLDHGTDVIPGAIAALQQTRLGLVADSATSQADFNTRLASGAYQLAIFGEQNAPVFAASQGQLTTFLASGGALIGATYLNGDFARLLGASGTTSTNPRSIAGTGPLFDGLPASLTLINPGWVVAGQGYALAAGATCLATVSNGGCGAVLANDGHTLLLAPLFDTYLSPEDGSQLIGNGGTIVLGPTTTAPEPMTLALVAGGLLATASVARRQVR